MATLLPAPEQQWIDANGAPLAGGSVATYIPGTTTPKATWQDSAGTIQNTNPITLDAAGRAIIYGSGSYRFIVQDADGNTIYDQVTADTAVGGLAWGGTSTGTPNAQVIAASSFSQQGGQQISFIVGGGLTNTGGATVSPGGSGGVAVLKDSMSGPTALTGGELVAGNAALLVYDATRGAFHLVNQPPQVIPSGTIWMFGMSTAPQGWLVCDASAVSRATYANLFAAIGTTYGAGNGTTTFNLPPPGYFPRMWNGSGSGVDPGRAIGSTQGQAIQSHNHAATVTDPGHIHPFEKSNAGASGGSGGLVDGGTITNTAVQSATTGISVSIQNTGGSETRPPNIAFMFAIKT